jgi:hypothetical protein
MPIQFRRIDRSDNASEVLSLVKPTDPAALFACAELDQHLPYLVQITTGTEPGDDFVGLYDLDGDKVDQFHIGEWELAAAAEVPADVVDLLATSWETGSWEVTRIR